MYLPDTLRRETGSLATRRRPPAAPYFPSDSIRDVISKRRSLLAEFGPFSPAYGLPCNQPKENLVPERESSCSASNHRELAPQMSRKCANHVPIPIAAARTIRDLHRKSLTCCVTLLLVPRCRGGAQWNASLNSSRHPCKGHLHRSRTVGALHTPFW